MSDLASAAFYVVMVGHSLFGTTGPGMLESALQATTPGARVEAQIINGAPLKYNWDHSGEAQGIDARSILPQGATTDLILTEAIPLANHLAWSETGVYAQAFAGLALSGRADARVFVQETWHSLKSGTGAQIDYDDKAATPWHLRLQEDLADWEGIVSMLRAGVADGAARVQLIPVGQALARLDDAIAAGQVPGLGGIDAVFADDIHLNGLGHYFVSMVQYATLTGASPEGLPHRVSDGSGKPVPGLDAELAAVLQRVAQSAVEAYRSGEVAQARTGQVPRIEIVGAGVGARAPPVAAAPLRSVAARQAPQGALAVGLAQVTDWSTQQPFLDVMKTARPWIGHLPGQFGGMDYAQLQAGGYLDAQGWLLRKPPEVGSVGTLILTDLPEASAPSLEGRYVLRFEGTGVVEVAGRARGVRYGAGEVRFDFTPGPGSVEIRIQRSSTDDPVRRISVVREDRLAEWEAGALFNPDWTARLAPFDTLRMMDWMETNDSRQALWPDRPMVSDASWARTGVPLEIMLALANELDKNIWVNMPHLADDAYVRAFAQTVRDGLEPGRAVYVEYSNEVWNFQFEQARWTDAQARARWGQADVGTQFYALRAAEIARIWREVMGPEQGRLVNVISSQTGWLGLEKNILNAPLVVAEGLPKPQDAFDAYAVTGYFGGILGLEERREAVAGWLDESLARATDAATAQGLTGEARAQAIAAAQYDYASGMAAQELLDGSVSGENRDTVDSLITRIWPYHAQVAQDAGLELIMYEGGTHLVGIGPQVDDARLTAFFQHFNYSAEMGRLHTALLDGWEAVGGRLFNVYADVYAPTKWGSWGALRYLNDSNPRWDALVEGR